MEKTEALKDSSLGELEAISIAFRVYQRNVIPKINRKDYIGAFLSSRACGVLLDNHYPFSVMASDMQLGLDFPAFYNSAKGLYNCLSESLVDEERTRVLADKVGSQIGKMALYVETLQRTEKNLKRAG